MFGRNENIMARQLKVVFFCAVIKFLSPKNTLSFWNKQTMFIKPTSAKIVQEQFLAFDRWNAYIRLLLSERSLEKFGIRSFLIGIGRLYYRTLSKPLKLVPKCLTNYK